MRRHYRTRCSFDLAAAFAAITAQPGIPKHRWLHLVRVEQHAGYRDPDALLSRLEAAGFLISEDEQGCLYPFQIKQERST